MEWSNIRMSKAEFERLQKEYTEAAIRTAEKAKLSYDADEPKEEIPKTENIAAAISHFPTPEEENVNETIKPDTAKIATVQVKITEAAQMMKQATLKSTAISPIIQPIPRFPTKPKITL